MVRATWHGMVIADSDHTALVEGNHYFPRSAVREEYLRPSDTHTTCPWKGIASYYDLAMDAEVNPDAVWYYPRPREAAEMIRDKLAFGGSVDVTDD